MASDFTPHIAHLVGALVCLFPGTRVQRTGMIWQPGVIVTACEGLPSEDAPVIRSGSHTGVAKAAGRDAGTNIALFHLTADAPQLPAPGAAAVGGLALILGAADDGGPTARLAVIHRLGPAWDSMAGGRIDQLIQLDGRMMPADEGGPVLDSAGLLLGMSTLGPRRRALVIPAGTIGRVVGPLLAGRRVEQGWLGIGLQPVAIPTRLQEAAGREIGLMIVSLAPHGPAEAAGVLPGDILLQLDAEAATHPRAVANTLASRTLGDTVVLRLLRAGQVTELAAIIAARPAR